MLRVDAPLREEPSAARLTGLIVLQPRLWLAPVALLLLFLLSHHPPLTSTFLSSSLLVSFSFLSSPLMKAVSRKRREQVLFSLFIYYI